MRFLFVINNLYQWERIGILTLSSVLKAHHHEICVYDINQKSKEKYTDDIRRLNPDIIAFSTMTTEVMQFLKTNSLLKARLPFTFKSVFGGPHPTFFPELIDDPAIDAVCRGEAEEAIVCYAEYLNGRRDANKVPNFWIKEGATVIRNDLALWPTELDRIPFPDRGLWDVVDPCPSQKAFFASRGCPYSCTYCFNHHYNRLYGNPLPVVRRRSVDNVIAEVKQVTTAYPGISPFFDDASFLKAPFRWLEEFKEKYAQEVAKPFGCNIRPDQVTEEKIRLLAEAGCHHCFFGVECGDEEFSNRVMMRNLPNEKIHATARLLRRYGIRSVINVINALPTDDPIATDMKTLDLSIQCKPDFVFANPLFPFPGTDLERYSRERGLFDGDIQRLQDPLMVSVPLTFEKRLRGSLQRQNRLFAIVVAFPFLRPMLPFLRKLPLLKLYVIFNLLYSGYCTRIKLTPTKKNPRYLLALLLLFLRKTKAIQPYPRSITT